MQNIKVGIIDDDSSKVTQIMTYLKYSMRNAPQHKMDKYAHIHFDIIVIELSMDMEEVIQQIINENIDVLLIDYNLSSYEALPYTGVELAIYIQKKFFDFPLFILTSYEDELYEKEVFDTYQIFDFERYLSEEKERIELHYKLIEQVTKYRKQRELWKQEIKELISQKGKTAEIDNRILELDSKLEKSIDGLSAIPINVKKQLNSDKLSTLINKIDLLLKEE